MSPSPMMVLETPAAQSKTKRLMEGMQAVISDVPAAMEVHRDASVALKGRSVVGAL